MLYSGRVVSQFAREWGNAYNSATHTVELCVYCSWMNPAMPGWAELNTSSWAA
jgi:hypothetical protein